MSEPPPLSLPALAELAGSARSGVTADHSPFGSTPYLLVDGDDGTLGSVDRTACTDWIARQPCPVIILARDPARHDALLDACDLRLTGIAEARTPIAHIRNAPFAAMVLVQVLRATESLPAETALDIESLAYATLQHGPEFARWQRNTQRPASISGDTDPALRMARDGDELHLTLNRPENRNAMSVEMRDALCEALALVAADETLRHVTIDGAGDCFSTGGDLAEFGTAPDPATAHGVRCVRLPARLLLHCAGRVTFRVHGACIGSGIEVPAFGGRVVATADSFFQLPEIRFGLIPGAGGCISLPRRIGRQRTAWLALSARRINARQALAWGLVDAIE
ncbi:MAG: enoyl-CoA hydratase/isomerase family protein [Proteobacteria bacterium]|nr:enoyl-CoA hydratase/isomerase family protein [Pseudomonadota bacterium]HQR03029.1 enoyl-CoA hydratase/isomerase family protein [Rhodocyclaceae bacterium]